MNTKKLSKKIQQHKNTVIDTTIVFTDFINSTNNKEMHDILAKVTKSRIDMSEFLGKIPEELKEESKEIESNMDFILTLLSSRIQSMLLDVSLAKKGLSKINESVEELDILENEIEEVIEISEDSDPILFTEDITIRLVRKPSRTIAIPLGVDRAKLPSPVLNSQVERVLDVSETIVDVSTPKQNTPEEDHGRSETHT
tara:strand:- start:508 stop:1101 length:594 start_codon:yes stop_codon:yes gene_type:complete